MPGADRSPHLARFENFELDVRAGELRPLDGAPVRLPEQSLRILVLLLERPGEVVQREEIQKKLWPNDTIVEFEHSISAAVNRLRQALGDSADKPKYVETLARRGYRWMVPVEWAEGSPALQPGAAAEKKTVESSDGRLIGRKVSHYRVLQILGGGGMGVVYEAEDLKLGRRVALKFLPEELGNDSKIVERFEQEARAASALDHPNICAIHEFGEHEGQPFIVMPLLRGQTLRERIAAGDRLALGGILDIAIQIADGLDAAHQKGIIHRDIKPANIFITDRGGIKILDFGLAKILAYGEQSEVSSGNGHEPTVLPVHHTSPHDLHLTRTGLALGTAAYMSPEQVRGEKLDARTDLFSFGLVLYEMATGRQAFYGNTAAELHEAILNGTQSPARELNPELPPKLGDIIQRALEKDREARYASASEMRADLKGLQQETAIAAVGVPAKRDPEKEGAAYTAARLRERWRRWLPRAFAAVLVSGLLALGTTTLMRVRKAEPAMHAAFLLPPGFRLDAENTSLALSPGGEKLAFAAEGPDGKQQLWLRSMGDIAVKALADTEGAIYPFWSPDGRYLGFFADRKLKKLEISSGAVQAICDVTVGRGGSWNRDGMIAFAPAAQGPLYEVSASGGTPIQLTSAKSGISNRLPHFLPDGKRLLFFSGDAGRKDNGIYSLDLETRRVKLVAREDSEGIYVEPGYLVFVRGRNLMAQRLDARRLQTSGQATPIAKQVLYSTLRWTGAYSFSDTGLLVFQSGSGAVKSRLTWFDTEGKNLGTVGQPDDFTFVSISPDGKRALTEVMGPDGRVNLWMYNLGRGIATPFSSGPGSYRDPVWSPDARSVVYDDRANINPNYVGPDGTTEYEFHRKALDDTSDNSSDARVPSAGGIPNSWSPDGQSLAFMTGDLGTAMWILPMVGPGKPYPFVVTPVGEIGSYWKRGSFSPDGRWFCYLSDETGRYELFVAPFPGPGGKWQISFDGADAPQWVGGGGELVYINAERKLVAVGVRAKGQSLETGQAHVLFGGQPLPALPCDPSTYGSPVYLTADGKRILLPVPLQEGSSPSLTLVTNWTAGLKN